MPIVEDEDPGEGESIFKSIFNVEKLEKLFSIYKTPLVLAAIGLVFFLTGIIYIFKTQNTSSDVIFSSESSVSARLSRSKIHIDVEGAVLAPGVYTMEEGSLVADALVTAGGLSSNADREWIGKNLNRAAKLIDGGKIFIPSLSDVSSGNSEIRNPRLPKPGTGGQAKSENSLTNSGNLLGVITGKVNINSASQAELEGLPGVGPVSAMKIINGRPYQTIEELKTKKIVGNALFEKIKDLLSL